MMMGAGFIFMLVFWGLLIVGAVWLLKSIFPGVTTPGDSTGTGSMSAREILDHRYARGEINREQYQRMVEDLQDSGVV